ncbi:aldehyde dehydrogenase family protein [Haladaptatus cibarius]|uniref:aldehyde dehydrogenase family protein n=1 Tax=Haladaptatus cibarius TaxID=453847 RepID=UPI000679414F
MTFAESARKTEQRRISNLSITPGGDWNTMYIDGTWRAVGDRDTCPIIDPTTRDAVGSVPAATTADVDDAYQCAVDAQREWAERTPDERAEAVATARGLLDEYADDLVRLFAIECGGVRFKAELETDLTRGTMEVAESLASDYETTEHESVISGKKNLVKQVPTGVVGVISPWNFPLYLSMRVVAPAIALGNSVVLKPSTSTAITGGLALAKLFDEAGLPDGVLNVVTGKGSEIGTAVASHPTPSVISFTGSTEVGREVGAAAARQLSVPALELGGNNVHIVTPEADLDRAVDGGVFGSFTHQGQECISINRHVVHETVYDEYVTKLVARAESLPVGDPMEDGVIVGPVMNEKQRDSIVALVDKSVAQGATVETGGSHNGWFVEPTVLSAVTNEMPIAVNEHFGPIAPVIPYETDEEAIEIANATEYGLSGSIHSTDIDHAMELANDINTGMVHINDQTLNDEPHIPFGGVNGSGIGRYNGEWIMDELTETRWISVQEEPRAYPY